MTTNDHKQAAKPKIWFNQRMTKEHTHFVNLLTNKLEGGAHPLGILFEAQALSALVGFDFNSVGETLDKLAEEAAEVKEAAAEGQDIHLVDELGDVLFSVVNVARHLGIHPDILANATAKKYLARCRYIEEQLDKDGKNWQDLTPPEIKQLWQEAKQNQIGEEEFASELTPYLSSAPRK